MVSLILSLSPIVLLVSEDNQYSPLNKTRLGAIQDFVGRMSELTVAAVLGNHFLYEVRDTTPNPVKWLTVFVVIVLVGLATS